MTSIMLRDFQNPIDLDLESHEINLNQTLLSSVEIRSSQWWASQLTMLEVSRGTAQPGLMATVVDILLKM